MEHHQVAEGEVEVQLWKVAANVFNKQSQTAEKGWSFSWDFCEGLKPPGRKNMFCNS
jgi:hypothetical protein